jgi:hypothetical protein
MLHWEYCEMDWADVTVRYYGTRTSRAERIKRDDTKGDRSDRDAWRRAIADLGEAGWELVGIRDGANGYHMYFKRPLPDADVSSPA